MPLAFQTLSHGDIPIGFFNIETDMFIIDQYFIFAGDLCEAITEWTSDPEDQTTELDWYIIDDQKDIGDLMGAIKGVVLTGFIGELYKLYPFPKEEEDFKQNPEGYKTRSEVEKLIKNYSKLEKLKVKISKEEGTITIGDYQFNQQQFHEVIAYIWRGGMPMWKDDIRPDYVENMMKAVLSSTHWLFKASP